MYDFLPKMLEDIMICSTLGCVAQIRETWNPKLLSFDFSAIGFAMFCMGSEETYCHAHPGDVSTATSALGFQLSHRQWQRTSFLVLH